MNIRKIKIAGIITAAAGTAVIIGCAAGKDSGNSDGGVPVAQIVDTASQTTPGNSIYCTVSIPGVMLA